MKAGGCRRKGSAGERELVGVLQAAGIPARRVPLSGAMSATGFGGDVVVRDPDGRGEERWEVKRRGQGLRRLEGWLTDAAVVAFRADRGEWLVCMRLADYIADRTGRGGRDDQAARDRPGEREEAGDDRGPPGAVGLLRE